MTLDGRKVPGSRRSSKGSLSCLRNRKQKENKKEYLDVLRLVCDQFQTNLDYCIYCLSVKSQISHEQVANHDLKWGTDGR